MIKEILDVTSAAFLKCYIKKKLKGVEMRGEREGAALTKGFFFLIDEEEQTKIFWELSKYSNS